MAILAIAYHSLALERLHEYFGGEAAGVSAASTHTKCEKCNLAFAIVLPLKDDPQNDKYVERLSEIIAGDCINGMHREEYLLERNI
jgi:hypothetical protein